VNGNVVPAGVRIDATEEGPTDASGDARIDDADHVFHDNPTPGLCGHR
jgi:hypothetical protein